MQFKFKYVLLAILFVFTSCNKGSFVTIHDTIYLNGSWRFALDTAKVGITEKWYSRTLSDSPGLNTPRVTGMELLVNSVLKLIIRFIFWQCRSIPILF